MTQETPSKAWIPITAAIIGGICAVIAAITGVVSSRVLDRALPAPTPTAIEVPVVTAESFKLAGVWEGTDPSGVVFRFTFASKCNIGDVCGKVELPTVGCTAIPVLVSTDGVTFEFDETNHQNCGPDTGNDVIKLLSDGTALFGGVGQPPTIPLYKK